MPGTVQHRNCGEFYFAVNIYKLYHEISSLLLLLPTLYGGGRQMERPPTLCNLCILFSLFRGHTRCGSFLILLWAPKIAFRSKRASANFRWLLNPATINRHHTTTIRSLHRGTQGNYFMVEWDDDDFGRASGSPNTTGVGVRSVYRLLRRVTSCVWSNRDRSAINGWLWWGRVFLDSSRGTTYSQPIPIQIRFSEEGKHEGAD